MAHTAHTDAPPIAAPVPACPAARGLFELGEYAFLAVYRSSYGMSVANLADPNNGMTTVWLILACEWVLFMALAWYLEQVRRMRDGCAAGS